MKALLIPTVHPVLKLTEHLMEVQVALVSVAVPLVTVQVLIGVQTVVLQEVHLHLTPRELLFLIQFLTVLAAQKPMEQMKVKVIPKEHRKLKLSILRTKASLIYCRKSNNK